MQKFLLIGLVSGLVACGSASQSALAGAPSPAAHPLYSFERDDRPLDGNFNEVLIKLNAEGSYDASLHTITSGFGSPIQDLNEELGLGLDCQAEETDKVLTSLICSYDNRPADGYLIEVLVHLNEEGTYDVSVHKAAYGRIDQQEVDFTNEIAFGMTRQN